MLLKRWSSTEARFHNARRSYHVGSPSPSRIVGALARRHLRSDCHGIALFERLASFSTCFPKPHPYLATCCIYRGTLLSVDSRRVSSGWARSSFAHVSHGKALVVDDRRLAATVSRDADLAAAAPTAGGLYSKRCFSQASAMVKTQPAASSTVLARGHGCSDRMASPRYVPTGHAIPLGAQRRGLLFSIGWPFVLVARSATFADRDKVASLVLGLISFHGRITL